MAKPYPMDFRERVIVAIQEAGLSCQAAAKRFEIAPSTAIGWLKRVRETGSVAPGQMGGHKPKKIVGEHRDWLIKRCRQSAFTLRGLVAELADRDLDVDYRSVWDFVHAEGLSFKKKRWSPASRNARM